jgi:hypothetical protein
VLLAVFFLMTFQPTHSSSPKFDLLIHAVCPIILLDVIIWIPRDDILRSMRKKSRFNFRHNYVLKMRLQELNSTNSQPRFSALPTAVLVTAVALCPCGCHKQAIRTAFRCAHQQLSLFASGSCRGQGACSTVKFILVLSSDHYTFAIGLRLGGAYT